MAKNTKPKKKQNAYKKWGYIFLLPFAITYLLFQLIPLLSTFFYSFFEMYRINGLIQVGPNFVGLDNYIYLFKEGDLLVYLQNTLIMWIMGFIPQILVSLLLAAWFSNTRLRIKHAQFFKTVIYLPNLIMASAFAMLFYALFSEVGPINSILMDLKILDVPYKFMENKWSVRTLVAFMNFLMWFGNTTLLLMAGMMGIDSSLYEAAEVDGATSGQVFTKITMPLLKPIFLYVMITSLIGGLQMFDVPQILTGGTGNPMRSSMTLIMYLNNHLFSKNYGVGGALSVLLFIVTAILSVIIFKVSGNNKKVK